MSPLTEDARKCRSVSAVGQISGYLLSCVWGDLKGHEYTSAVLTLAVVPWCLHMSRLIQLSVLNVAVSTH